MSDWEVTWMHQALSPNLLNSAAWIRPIVPARSIHSTPTFSPLHLLNISSFLFRKSVNKGFGLNSLIFPIVSLESVQFSLIESDNHALNLPFCLFPYSSNLWFFWFYDCLLWLYFHFTFTRNLYGKVKVNWTLSERTKTPTI